MCYYKFDFVIYPKIPSYTISFTPSYLKKERIQLKRWWDFFIPFVDLAVIFFGYKEDINSNNLYYAIEDGYCKQFGDIIAKEQEYYSSAKSVKSTHTQKTRKRKDFLYKLKRPLALGEPAAVSSAAALWTNRKPAAKTTNQLALLDKPTNISSAASSSNWHFQTAVCWLHNWGHPKQINQMIKPMRKIKPEEDQKTKDQTLKAQYK